MTNAAILAYKRSGTSIACKILVVIKEGKKSVFIFHRS
ncbi:hypothetical protein D1BOALGB6SA_1653 [Olavius sp. associated proteobacterium Delta 1]|nr:hypothetical protein D1BOALGB6SA_1653 [Olavius sp. associated proteobacterium Delta 1]